MRYLIAFLFLLIPATLATAGSDNVVRVKLDECVISLQTPVTIIDAAENMIMIEKPAAVVDNAKVTTLNTSKEEQILICLLEPPGE